MTSDEIEKLLLSVRPPAAKAYRLVQERAGCLYYVPSQDAPPLCLSPFELGGVPPGVYGVLFVDGGKEFVLKTPINVVVESLFPVVNEGAAGSLAMEASEVGHSLEIEKLNADTLMVRGGAQAFNDNLVYYGNFQRALGLHSSAALRIENSASASTVG